MARVVLKMGEGESSSSLAGFQVFKQPSRKGHESEGHVPWGIWVLGSRYYIGMWVRVQLT